MTYEGSSKNYLSFKRIGPGKLKILITSIEFEEELQRFVKLVLSKQVKSVQRLDVLYLLSANVFWFFGHTLNI